MDLASVFIKYAAEGTGQLALKFADTSHLCKVAVEDGEAVFIKLGTMSPEETLEYIRDKQLVEASFIKGFRARKHLLQPITQQLTGGIAVEIDSSLHSDKRHIVTATIPGITISKLLNDYIDIVGPLGVVMTENYIKKIGYVQGAEMGALEYSDLVKQLIVDIPESLRGEFITVHS
ncbi:MAG: hypothetical protein J7K75_05240 [Desulfuromonas sp.]|nr:hypothetical protein [Desulfuromonas sp.]